MYRTGVAANSPTPHVLILTDLDGTLLDPLTYSFEAAIPALTELKRRSIPVVLVSSKTRAEIEPIRNQLGNRHPFVVENGGGLFIPQGLFDFPLDGAVSREDYLVIEQGIRYEKLRAQLKDIATRIGSTLRGFGDMSIEEISTRTGLSYTEAVLAKRREYDEPFVVEGATVGQASTVEKTLQQLREEASSRGLQCLTGGRFHHLLGPHDKGQACRDLIRCYRRRWPDDPNLVTIALGDSHNDLAMLAEVDYPVLIPRVDGSYDPHTRLPNLLKASGVGPIGWNTTVLSLLDRLTGS